MFKKLLLMSLLTLFALPAFSGSFPARNGGRVDFDRAKVSKAEVMRIVPHLAVNEDWVSELTIRSDSLAVISMILEFRDASGNPTTATFYDSFGNQYTDSGFAIPDLQPYEIYSLDFDQLFDGNRNLQVFVFSDESQASYALEASYHRFQDGQKVASVGVPTVAPGNTFIMNVDQRFDPITGNRRFRGLAITNVHDYTVTCLITLFNKNGYAEDEFGLPYDIVRIEIPPYGKWVGTVYNLYPNIDNHLNDDLGYLYVEANGLVSTMGLGFEANTPIATSFPIDYFTEAKAKAFLRAQRR